MMLKFQANLVIFGDALMIDLVLMQEVQAYIHLSIFSRLITTIECWSILSRFWREIYRGIIEVLIDIEQFSDLFKAAFHVIVVFDKMCPWLPWSLPIWEVGHAKCDQF